MAIPLSYNLRNLRVRKTSTVMTALGVALTVAVVLAVLAMVEGLRTAFRVSGHPRQVLVMRKGSTAEITSTLSRSVFQDLKFKREIERDAAGQPMASLEFVTVINLERADSPGGMNVTLRGLTPMGITLRDGLTLERGRWFNPGLREVVVGKSIAKRFPGAQLGQPLRFGRGDWQIVGIMSAGESAVNSEIFGDLYQVSTDYNRSDLLSCVLIRATDDAAAAALMNSLKSDQRLNVDARSEISYYESQTGSAAPVQFLGMFLAVIMGVGSCFAAMNTMYAAVARRAKEIGTLRVVGFSQRAILASFLIESLILSGLGGVIGCLLVLPLNNVTTGLGSLTTFSEIAFNFNVTPAIMTIGMVFALGMGTVGGLFPARGAAKKEILAALRDI
jgi:putative ABC transport system permease protein